ncbi:MAG: hypothetical protein V3V49_06660 [Candidatus Krumholzibacteria bacterium]
MMRSFLLLMFSLSILGGANIVVQAVELPLERFFLGSSTVWLIEEEAFYPASYVSWQARYWDLYYERKSDQLQDYHLSEQRLRSMRRRGPSLIGFELSRSVLTLKQDNIHTDADRLRGTRDHLEGKIYLGRVFKKQRFAGVDEIELVTATGWKEGFTGEIEARFGWQDRGSLLLRAETFGNKLELTQDINGSTFPFHFPFRTDRFHSRLEVVPITGIRVRTWGGIETSSGNGEEERGFSNRLWFQRKQWGGLLDYRLQPQRYWQKVPRLGKIDSRLPGMRLSAIHERGNGDVGMYFGGVRYLHLQDLNSRSTTFRLDLVPLRNASIFGGWHRVRIMHDGDSFFDPWPFTVWDMFLAKRYRLDESEFRLDTWFVGLGKIVETDRFELELSGRFEWWEDSGELQLLERVDVLFPFFFKYERSGASPSIPFRYALQLDPSVLFRVTSGIWLRFSGQAAYPFGKESSDPVLSPDGGGGALSPVGSDGKSTHGGLTGYLEVIFSM